MFYCKVSVIARNTSFLKVLMYLFQNEKFSLTFFYANFFCILIFILFQIFTLLSVISQFFSRFDFAYKFSFPGRLIISSFCWRLKLMSRKRNFIKVLIYLFRNEKILFFMYFFLHVNLYKFQLFTFFCYQSVINSFFL